MIRPFHLRDSWLVNRLQQVGRPLDLEEQLTHPRSPLRAVFMNALLSPRLGPSTFILHQKDDQHELLGLAQIRARPGRPERDVVFMSPRLDNGPGSHKVWQRLLTHLCVQTAERGGLRVYARLPVESEEVQLFKHVGFLEYCQEEVFELERSTSQLAATSMIELRPQRAADGWGLQKLYAGLAPRAVQNAEGLAQGRWDLTHRRWGEQGKRYGYVWEVSGELLAALHLRTGKQGCWVSTLLHPDALEHAEALCQAALNLISRKPDMPVFFAFRQYETGWQHVLPMLGFTPLTSQTLMVKSMAVRVRDRAPAIMSALESTPTEGAATSLISNHAELGALEPQNGHARHSKIFSLLL